MRPVASSENARRRMVANRRRDTGPEVSLRRELHARGWRFRVDFPPIPGLRRRADVAFTRPRVAVFLDGCFWHRCPEHATDPTANADFWASKFARNVERDRDTDTRLRDAGWTVVRVWEHEPVLAAADRIEQVLRRGTAS